MNFGSDNQAGVHDAILDAIRDANTGTAAAYGYDDWSAAAERRLRDVFECDLTAYLVTTGTAANALALAACCPPHGAVVCHHEAHITTDECGAPEMFTGGAKLMGVRGVGRQAHPGRRRRPARRHGPRRTRAAAQRAVAVPGDRVRHHLHPGRGRGAGRARPGRRLHVHMDGARFANALVRLGVTPAETSWKAGVDVLSFGATKNGALASRR